MGPTKPLPQATDVKTMEPVTSQEAEFSAASLHPSLLGIQKLPLSTKDMIKNNYLPDLSGMMKISLKVSCSVKERGSEEMRDFLQDVSPRGHYENQKKKECLLFFNPDLEGLYRAVRTLLHQIYDNHCWKIGTKPPKKILIQADHSSPSGIITESEIPAKEGTCKKKVYILSIICQNLKTIMECYGEEINQSKASVPPIGFEIDRDLETFGRLVQATEFCSIETSFCDIMTTSYPEKEKVARLSEAMNNFKKTIMSGPLTGRRAKNCFLFFRASEYLKHFEEELELKDKDTLSAMHRLRTQITFELIEHSFLFVQNDSPLFDVVVDRYKLLQKTSCETFFYLEASNAHKYIVLLFSAIDMKMKNIVDDYSSDMLTPEEFVSFANNDGRSMKKSEAEQIEELQNKILDMKKEANDCLINFSAGAVQQVFVFLSSVLLPLEAEAIKSLAFGGITLLKKLRSLADEKKIKEKGEEFKAIFSYLLKRQELLRKVHYSSLILQKMRTKTSELLRFLEMIRLYNVLTVRNLHERSDYIGLLITRKVNPITEFVEFFVRPLEKFN